MEHDYEKLFEEAMQHLVQVLGVAQTPKDLWRKPDDEALREARKFVEHVRIYGPSVDTTPENPA